MKGIILAYSAQTNKGVISAEDSTRYHFAQRDWRELETPKRGTRVNFDLDSSGYATNIYYTFSQSQTG